MALATNSTPGSIVIAGDLTGTATAPQLRPTGVVPGTYENAAVVVDSKGRVVQARDAGALVFDGDMIGMADGGELVTELSSLVPAGTYPYAALSVDAKGRVTDITAGSGAVAGDLEGYLHNATLSATGATAGTHSLAAFDVDEAGRITNVTSTPLSSVTFSGDLTGSAATSTLSATGVTAGSYNIANVTVDAQGRITTASSTTSATFAGDVSGLNTALVLSNTTVTPGTYTNANVTVDAKGRVTAASNGTLTSLAGDLYGATLSTTVLDYSGVTEGTYTNASITVDAKGRITAASSGGGDATYALPGLVQVSADTGLTLTGGNLSMTNANGTTTMGAVKSAGADRLSITSGAINTGSNVLTTSTTPTFAKALRWNATQVNQLAAYTPSLLDDSSFVIQRAASVNAPIDDAEGDVFDITFTPTMVEHTLPSSTLFSYIAWNGTFYVACGPELAATSNYYILQDDIWTLKTAANAPASNIVWNGSFFVAQSATDKTVKSTDGLTWTAGTAGFTFNAIVWNGSVFCAVRNISSSSAYTSTDGLTWTTRTLPYTAQWNSIAANPHAGHIVPQGTMVMVSNNYCVQSIDNGNTWASVTGPLSSYGGIKVVYSYSDFFVRRVGDGTVVVGTDIGLGLGDIAQGEHEMYTDRGVDVSWMRGYSGGATRTNGVVLSHQGPDGPAYTLIGVANEVVWRKRYKDGAYTIVSAQAKLKYHSSYKFPTGFRDTPGIHRLSCVVSGSNQYCV